MRLPRLFALALLAASAACSSPSNDPAATVDASPLGGGSRIRDIGDPTLPGHLKSAQVSISSASVLWVDTYDETHDGKSRGTLFVQDVGSREPYSGVSVYQPSYVPADLRAAPGDVLDFAGQYEELANVGKAIFTPPQVLPQLAKPVATFRYELPMPDPTPIDAADLNDYDKGRKWEGMLVTVHDLAVLPCTTDANGRTACLFSSAPNAGSISNELCDLRDAQGNAIVPSAGGTLKSVTGIVTWFFSFHIAPRTAADLQVQ